MAQDDKNNTPRRDKHKIGSASRKKSKSFTPGSRQTSNRQNGDTSSGKIRSTTVKSSNTDINIAVSRRKPVGIRLKETIPLILETGASSEYALLDSGNGRKLERYGPVVIERPEAQAFWQCERDSKAWGKADAIFNGDRDEDGTGRWQFPHALMGETWPLSWEGEKGRLDFHGRFTSFRHVGVFPEQAAHWQFIEQQIITRSAKPGGLKLLNLFGYTGIASLVAARAGATVTHVDASKKAIGWARENQLLARLQDKPIRWICDDAVKFCEREIRRNNRYDAIILDPPKYGRGPKGEVWQLFESLPHMIDLCRELISTDPAFVILTSYSIRSSFYAMHELMQEVFGDCGGELQSGELIIRTQDSRRVLSTSLFSRWIAKSNPTQSFGLGTKAGKNEN
ncbi:MAG: class I SAM-dependent rRNA methyltransferase [Hyphomicrobiales bacterium]|nr:class I SAM-dependent rRNA methyltransferase [Hyphomicrobiales bacterium]